MGPNCLEYYNNYLYVIYLYILPWIFVDFTKHDLFLKHHTCFLMKQTEQSIKITNRDIQETRTLLKAPNLQFFKETDKAQCHNNERL